MPTMLITEALQQVKILKDRISKKQELVTKYVTHNSRFVDPLLKQGGSEAVVKAELQSIADLEENLVAIRYSIQNKNLGLTLTLEGETKTVAEWLIWRRDIAEGHGDFKNRLANVINNNRTRFEQEQKAANGNTPEGQTIKESNLVVNLDEFKLFRDNEKLGKILGSLDAKLSILNATTSIDVELVGEAA